MRRRRTNAGIFQRLLEGGSRTTYHGKIRDRKGKRTAKIRQGKQSVYKGVRIIPVGNGEFETSLDSSRFESKRDARRFVDSWKKRGNPAIPYPLVRQTGPKDALHGIGGGVGPGFNVYSVPVDKLRSIEDVRGMRDKMADVERYAQMFREGSEPPALFGHLKRSGKVQLSSGSRRLLAARQAGRTHLPVAIPNPKGKRMTKGDFSRCVKAVSQRKGAKDPEAICAAQERKRGLLNPEFYLVVPASGGSPVSRHYSHEEATKKRAALEAKTGRSYDVVAGDVDIRSKHGYRMSKQNPELQYASGRSKVEAERIAGKMRRDDAKLRKMGGSGNFDSVTVRKTFEGPGRSEYGVFVQKNPADAAMAVSEEFHGRKVKAMIPVSQKRHYHKYLAELGELRKLEVIARDGKHRVTLSKFDGAMLCTNEDKNQLFLVGGDQGVDLRDFGIKDAHETETLGEVTKIEYFTDKEHLGSEGGEAVYVHKFRTTNGGRGHKTVRLARNPDLMYYLRDEHLEFSGGSYFIRAEGIDL